MTEGTPRQPRIRPEAKPSPVPVPQPKPQPPPPEDDQLNRLPPHSIEAEQGVLGCILLAPLQTIALCVEKFKPGGAVFFDSRHRIIYEAVVSLWDFQKPIDLISLQQFLREAKQLEKIGGLSYLSELPDKTPSQANLDYYADILLAKFTLRKMVSVCSDIVLRAMDEPMDVVELIATASQAMQTVTDSTLVTSSVRSAKVLVDQAQATIELIHQHHGEITGITTGFIDLDQMTWGLHPAEVFILAGRPGNGKTTYALNIAEHVAVELNQPVGVFSLEMSDESLMLRCMCSRSRVSMGLVRGGFLGGQDWAKLAKAAAELRKAPLYVDDSSGLSILQLRAKARRMHQQFGIKLFVVDYLQLMNAAGKRHDNRQHEVSEISAGLKGLAKELKVPVVVLSQLNRKSEDRGKNAKPKMSDLRESGSIEQDADVVAMLYRNDESDAVNEQGQHSDAVSTNLLVVKNRNGPTGEINLLFLRGCTRFENVSKIDEADVAPAQSQPTLPYHDA